MEPKFTLQYGVSKKGNKTITVIQAPNEQFPYSQKRGFSALDKYKNIVKIKTAADDKYFKEYLERTVEEVFEIAYFQQNWKLIPFNPIKKSVMIKTEIPDWVYNISDWND